MKYQFEKYGNSNAWSLTPIKVAGATIERGKNKGKPNPQAGELIPVSGATIFPGNQLQLAQALLDKAFEGYSDTADLTDLTAAFDKLTTAVDDAKVAICAALTNVNKGTIDIKTALE